MRRVFLTLFLAAAAGVALVPAPGAGARDGRVSFGDPCGHGLIEVGDGLCTHGGDRVPEAVERAATGFAARAEEPARKKKANPRCAGDGVRGRRIRVLYGFPSDTTSRAAAFERWIRESVVLADQNLDRQSPGIPGQHLRMYCRNGRKVTVTCCYGPAGQGTIYFDDRADPAGNLNNMISTGPRFAMVEIGGSTATGAYVFLHEVGHTLGAVQDSAPHSSGAGHCYTGYDVMCYADGGPWFDGGGTMESVCPPMTDRQRPFDCEGGDYYEVDPASGSYLDEHWNTADSGWLTRPG